MDTSFWVSYNSKITVDHTQKKYYGRYLYKMVVFAPAGRLIDSKKPDSSIATALDHRKQIANNLNGGYWGFRLSRDIENADVDFLEELRRIRQLRVAGIKLRIEEPRIQIYAETDQQLKDLVNLHFGSKWNSYVEEIAGPADETAEDFLNSGAIIRKIDNGYKHKVILRDGRYGSEVKENLLNYLLSLGSEQVGLSSSIIDTLKKSSGYMWNVYFYVNDPSVTTFINLIHPNLVLNIHELVVLANK